MDLVLYHPEWGYYSGGQVDIGKDGDFFTASSLGADFGELLAEQFLDMQEILQIQPFQIVEMGAGKGELARDILHYFQRNYPQKAKHFEYIILEKSPALKRIQQAALAEFTDLGIHWQDWETLPEDSIQGCFFSNELVDAFPVHRIQVKNQTLQEIYVGRSPEGNLIEMVGEPSTPELQEYFAQLDIDINNYPDGFQTEVNLHIKPWLTQVERTLKQGYILTIDYGYPAAKYYHPQRYQGTLQCYFQHRRHNNPLINPGRQDITAHVDFTSLQKIGESLGLQTLGLTQQGLFLMALGLGDRLNNLSKYPEDVMNLFRRRDALHQLMDPMGLGGFYVLLQGENLQDSPVDIIPKGLVHPQ